MRVIDNLGRIKVVQDSYSGVSGFSGFSGLSGFSGTGSITLTTAQFTVPAVNNTVSISVDSSDGFAVGQIIYIEGAGYYQVNSKSAGNIVAENLG